GERQEGTQTKHLKGMLTASPNRFDQAPTQPSCTDRNKQLYYICQSEDMQYPKYIHIGLIDRIDHASQPVRNELRQELELPRHYDQETEHKVEYGGGQKPATKRRQPVMHAPGGGERSAQVEDKLPGKGIEEPDSVAWARRQVPIEDVGQDVEGQRGSQ